MTQVRKIREVVPPRITDIDSAPLDAADLSKKIGKDPDRILKSLSPGKRAIFQTRKGVKFYVQMNQDGTYNVHHMVTNMDPKSLNPSPMSIDDVLAVIDRSQANFIVQESVARKIEAMKSNDIVKKDLLRRKIREHFSKNPKSKSVIVKADIGPKKTIWRAQKLASGVFNIVEVNTTREQFLITEVTGTPSPQYRKFTTEFVGAAANPNDRAAASRLSQAFGSLAPGPEKDEAQAAMAGIGMQAQSTSQLGKHMGGVGQASRTSTLSMGKTNKGKRVVEAEEKGRSTRD
jgi:hypothetical protein